MALSPTQENGIFPSFFERVRTEKEMSFFQHEGAQETSKDYINVDFLLPTGILIPLPCKPSQKLEDIKELLWRRAKEYPLFGLLRCLHTVYHDVCVCVCVI